jgi:site-specific DNA recombinase
MNTAVGYIRVSTSGQLDNTSLEDQAEQITKYCESNDLELKLPLYDEGWQSGADNDRPQLQKMLADADQKKFEVVVINSLDRFGREMVDMLINIRLLERAGVELISVKEKFGNDPLGKLVRNTLANYAEFEKAIIKDRTHSARNKRRKNKDIFIGRTAHGYRWNKIEKRIETIDGEAKTVKRIVHEYLNLPKSIPQVVETLHKEHILTRSGKDWTIALVAQLLRNPCYTGTYWTNKYLMNAKGKVIGEKPESEWVTYPCEELITPTDWERLQKRLNDARDKFSGAPNPESKKYIADGLLRCGLCNGTMRLRHTRPNKSGTLHSYYSCYWRIKSQRMAKLYGKTQCTMPLIPAKIMDEKLFIMSLPGKLGLDWQRKYEDKVNPSIEVDLDKVRQKVENIKTSISRNKTALTNLDRTQYAEHFNPDHYNKRLNELTIERSTLERELAEAERECLRYQQLFESEQSFKKIAADKDTIMELFRQIQGLPIDQKRRLLHGLVDGDIIVKPPTPDAVLEIEEGPNALNKWTKINWRYNPAIIQEILGVKIVSEVETTYDHSGMNSTQEIRLIAPGERHT